MTYPGETLITKTLHEHGDPEMSQVEPQHMQGKEYVIDRIINHIRSALIT